ncbi:hypothetical protein [Micromonospora sp. IBSANI012]|uniref:hypothetical protein n=1 Tax=Micromonospora sp. IBSANI012 TaxID=3457761 RepID=UPI004057EC7F
MSVLKSVYRLAVTIFAPHGGRPLVRLRAHGQLASPVAGDVLVTASVGPSGEAITLWADPAGREALLTPPGLAASCARQPVSARVVVQDASTTTVTAIAALDLPFSHVQPLPGGRILVVPTRGGRATVFDAAGDPVKQGDVGDGIEHVLTTPEALLARGGVHPQPRRWRDGLEGGKPPAAPS